MINFEKDWRSDFNNTPIIKWHILYPIHNGILVSFVCLRINEISMIVPRDLEKMDLIVAKIKRSKR